MSINFITAEEASNRTKSYNEKEDKELLECIQNFIIEATKQGKFQCIASSNKKIPKHILDFLKDKGYTVNYVKECLSQLDGYTINNTKIEIHW